MVHFIGEHSGKIDSKGRVIFPAPFRRMLAAYETEELVINRGFEPCLVLYPRKVWESISLKLSQLNQYQEKNRLFVRKFNNGATLLSLDSAGRILIPKMLLGYAGLSSDIYFAANGDKIEIWDKAAYESVMQINPSDFAALAEEVMGRVSDEEVKQP
jgi:MraZ protein